jgi:predicted nucleic acid-binding protein
MILCDTNILIELYKNNEQIIEPLRQIGSMNLAVSAVSVAELYYGAFDKAELRKIKKHLSLLHQLPLSGDISHTFLNLMESYSLSHKLSVPDALIAATALEHELPLYTLNLKDFRFITTLQLHTPVGVS